ncbi:MAG: SDR family oxidoreductase [Opitutales bacterium]
MHILITGTSRGLGRAMALEFAAGGHTVTGCGRNREALAQLADKLGGDHRFDALDVADPDAVQTWVTHLTEGGRTPDILINNAALINRNAPLWEVPAEEFDRLIDVNVKGVANLIRACLPAMIARGSGLVVNFSSGWGRSTSPEVAPYCCSKWAIEGLTAALAQELPDGLAAVALNPGIIATDMLRSAFGSGAEAHPDPDTWAGRAVPRILELGPADNGSQASV